ncbi:MAG: helix-turn-helix transcriptional regulator [Xenococcus sp. MO_188.B8]|nr:helix-turn-helix transcriptional regulator [Xenococcus sp. MO_188.B8]
MKASEAYDLVLEKYNIKAKDIAEAIGKSESDVSKFRNGHRKINQDLLQLYVQALPVEARAHFNMLWSYGDEINKLKISENQKQKS